MIFPRYFSTLLLAALATPLAAQQPSAAQPDAGIQLQFPNNGISDILGIYELLTGKPVIRDSGIFDACLKANVPVAWDLAGGYSEPMDMTVSLHLQTLRCSDLALRKHVQRQRRAERRRAERRLAECRRTERRRAAGA